MSVRNRNRRKNASNVDAGKGDIKQVEEKFVSDNSKASNKSNDAPVRVARKSNDPAWYNYSPEQVAAVANIAFSEPLGEIPPVVPSYYAEDYNNHRYIINSMMVGGIPGIMVVRTRPSFGYSLSITDPLNVSATELYVHVRYNNNGRKNYDASDLMIHTLAISDLYSLIMFIKKVYAAAFEYSNRNYYLGKNLLRALGFNPDSIVTNLANLRYWLNTFINKVQAYVVPGSIYLFKRRAFLYADVYTESEQNSIKDQMYTFMPDGFFKFKFDDDEGGLGAGMLDYVEWPGNKDHAMTFDEIVNFAEDLFENITQDEDFGLMSGDILKAFGNDIITVDPLEGEYFIDVHYDHEVLHQIMNATTLNGLSGMLKGNVRYQPNFSHYVSGTKVDGRDYKCGNIYQTNKGVLVYALTAHTNLDPEMIGTWLNQHRNVYLNTDSTSVTTDEVMEMTRLNSIWVDPVDGWRISDDSPLKVLACGSDIVVRVSVATMDNTANANLRNSKLSMYDINSDAIIHDVTDAVSMDDAGLKHMLWQNQFRYAPQCIEWRLRGIVPTPGMDEQFIYHVESIVQNLQNYTFISREQLDRIHRVAMYSLVHVPGVTKLINS